MATNNWPVLAFEKGHSDTDPGACSKKSGKYVCERDETEAVGALVVKKLSAYELNIVTDPKNNKGFDFITKANRLPRCDLYVALHFNAGGGVGAEVYTYSSKQDKYGEAFRKPFEAIGQKWRGVKHNELAVTRDTTMTAALVEGYFVDNPEAKKWATPEGREKMAEAVAQGILRAFSAKGYNIRRRKTSSGSGKPKPLSNFSITLTPVQKGSKHELARIVAIILKAYGDLPEDYSIPKKGYVFDSTAVKGLKQYQERHGLKVDGIAARRTITEMHING